MTPGLQSVFQSVFPISDFRNLSQLEFVDYAIGNWECKCGHLKGLHHLRTTCRNCGATVITDPFHPGEVLCGKCGTYNANTPDFCNKCGDPVGLQLKYDVSECEERGMTYSAPLKVTIRLTIFEKDPETGNKSIRDIKEQEVFFGDIPLMTQNGTFIINGTERVIVSQLHRSPGVFFETANQRTYFLGKIIPYRGSWVEFEYDQKNILYVRIDRKRKFLGTIFLRALGLRSDEDILRTFYTVDKIAVKDKKLYWTLEPGIDRPTSLAGMKLSHRVVGRGGEEIAHSGRKITPAILKEIQKAKVTEIEIDTTDLEGAFTAADVVDTTSGEVLARGQRGSHCRQGGQADRRRHYRAAPVLPRTRRCGRGHRPDPAPRFGQDAAGSAHRDLPQAASRRPADAGHRHLAVPWHVLRRPQVRLLQGRTAQVQHQAVRARRRHQPRSPHAGARGLLRHHPLSAEAAQEHRRAWTTSITWATAGCAPWANCWRTSSASAWCAWSAPSRKR